jgi:hypothetical protein
MSLRPPRQFSASARNPSSPPSALEVEMAQEMASALGRLGRRLERALAAIATFDAAGHGNRAGARARLVAEAGDALWHFIVQREACGLRDSRQIQRDYRIPAEVWARMGAFPAAGTPTVKGTSGRET